jgi:hypothetical protein
VKGTNRLGDKAQREALRDEDARRVCRMADRLCVKFGRLGVSLSGSKDLNRLPVDLTDMYFICENYQRLVRRLLTVPNEGASEDIIRIIFDIESHLYDHLPNHYKPLAKGLKVLTNAIEPDEEKLEALTEKLFFETMQDVRRGLASFRNKDQSSPTEAEDEARDKSAGKSAGKRRKRGD